MKPDLEKVIRGLECCTTPNEGLGVCTNGSCPYRGKDRSTCQWYLMDDTLTLLQAKPSVTATGNGIAVGQVTGGITINRTYNQTANEVTNIKNVGELHV